jgi:hypothetical protein
MKTPIRKLIDAFETLPENETSIFCKKIAESYLQEEKDRIKCAYADGIYDYKSADDIAPEKYFNQLYKN